MYGWERDEEEEILIETPSAISSSQSGQWGKEETKELIKIRAEVERGSASTKALWEAVSAELLLRGGFVRTPDQCKCKWKNLLNRYKGKETSDPSNGRECPFFEELHALFTERARKMHRLLIENEAGSPSSTKNKAKNRKKNKRKKTGPNNTGEPSSDDEFFENENEDDDDKDDSDYDNNNGEVAKGKNTRKRKAELSNIKSSKIGNSGGSSDGVREVLEEFLRRQTMAEEWWAEAVDRRSREQMEFEKEWRDYMERGERDRLASERAWREREEQRRAREECRAERRDALLTSLLQSLINE